MGVSRRSLFGLAVAPLLALLPREEKYVTYVSSIDYIDRVVTFNTVTEREFAPIEREMQRVMHEFGRTGNGTLNFRVSEYDKRLGPMGRKYGGR